MRIFVLSLYLIITATLSARATEVEDSAINAAMNSGTTVTDTITSPFIIPTQKATSKLKHIDDKNTLRITQFMIDNNYVPIVDSTDLMSPLGVATKIGSISLNRSENNLSFEFVDMSHKKIARSQVEYILRGFDKDYTVSNDSITRVNYTNLPPGNYIFAVRRVVGLYRGVQDSTRLDVFIRPPFYASNFAMFLYILLTTSVGFILLRLYDLKRLTQKRLDMERRDHLREKEYNQAILRFFTNVSHELRTPLTIIAGQLEHIMESDTLDPELYRRVKSAFNSAGKLQSLVDELLDLRKQQNGYATLKLHPVDMDELVKEIFVNYMELAADRGLKYTLNIEENKEIYAMADRVEIEKVLFNLLSNAFKFTRVGGVSVSLSCDERDVILVVEDTGKGIDKANLDNIFKQYYQEVRNDDFDPSVRGTGIGLALVSYIVKSHNGTIKLKSELNNGSTFTVRLPRTKPEESDQRLVAEREMVKDNSTIEVIDDLIDQSRDTKVSKQTILVVEDNDAMRDFLSDVLSKYYRVEVASDGQEGYDKAVSLLPSLVLSDVMMPNVSGTQMCTMIKTNYDTSHIPVVLLTAKVAMEHKIQGLSMGADDYITKPFSIKLLISRIDNILKSRRLLLERFSSDPDVGYKQVTDASGGVADDFLSVAFKTVVDNISNRNYTVDQFAEDMGMGRTKFFKKLKNAVDATPNDFILTVRLKHAISLINGDPELSIGEVSEMCGFNSQQYFSSCFRRKFGLTPVQYFKGERVSKEESDNNN